LPAQPRRDVSDEPRDVATGVQHVGDGVDNAVDVYGLDGQRGLQRHDVPAVRGRLTQNLALEQLQSDPLPQNPDEGLPELVGHHPSQESRIGDSQLDSDEEAEAPDVADERMAGQPVLEANEKLLPARRAVLRELLVVEDGERLERSRAGQGVAGERRAAQIEALHRAVRLPMKIRPGHRDRDRSDSAPERFRQHEHIGRDPFSLVREQTARAAQARPSGPRRGRGACRGGGTTRRRP
jgi:hypothetical protein